MGDEMQGCEWALRDSKELKPRTRTTINDHRVEEHRRWSDPEATFAVEGAVDDIRFFRF